MRIEQQKPQMNEKKSLISTDYKTLNQNLHSKKTYGEENHSINYRIVKTIDAAIRIKMCKSVLDYGCGKGLLVKKLLNHFGQSLNVKGYDPGIPEYDIQYSPADIVTCFDVLEHIEPENISAVLDDISNNTLGVFICIIDLLPAQKKLVDGRNAHLLIAPPGWWLDKLTHTFKCGCYNLYEDGQLNKKICYVGTNKKKYSKLASEIFAKTFF